MNFNESVNKDFVDVVLESALWAKANVKVNKNVLNEEEEIGVIPEYEDGIVNEFEEPTDIDTQYAVSDEEQESFSLDDLQVVLDNLDDDSLMEHAMNMLEVFDVAFETLNEEEEDEEDEEEEVAETPRRKSSKKRA